MIQPSEKPLVAARTGEYSSEVIYFQKARHHDSLRLQVRASLKPSTPKAAENL